MSWKAERWSSRRAPGQRNSRGFRAPFPFDPRAGSCIMLEGSLAHHVIYGGGGYLVPRRHASAPDSFERTIIGATMEDVGFDSSTTPAGLAELEAVARRICPASASASLVSHWAGLRPMTPDSLPILGPDPDISSLLYACGHGQKRHPSGADHGAGHWRACGGCAERFRPLSVLDYALRRVCLTGYILIAG